MKKIILLLALCLLIAVFFALDLQRWLTLEAMQSSQQYIQHWQLEQPLLVAAVFAAVYILVTALSLPGAAVLTLAAGAFFGVLWGLFIVSFASSIGATLAFLASRFIFRDSVQKRFGERLKTINAGVEREGAFYLFTLRLVPIFPFVLINLLMGLTPIKVRTFYWVSQLGMLLGTLVYVNAGTQLASLEHLSSILSPSILLSLALLGIFPLLAKKILAIIKQRRVYRRWNKPKAFDRNLIVIGAGAAGLVSAYIAAAVKAKVTLIEAEKMGGDCLNYGCVPSKALIKSAKVAQQIRSAHHYGLESSQPSFSFSAVMARVHKIIAAIAPHDSIERYTKLGVEVLQGYAKLVDPWTVEIAHNNGQTQRLTARSIIIAAGAKPFIPDIPGLNNSGYLTTDTLWHEFTQRDQTPKRLVILGGGPIGCELAQSFSRLGAQVTQIQRQEKLLPREDDDVSALARQSLESDGVQVLTGHQTLRCEKILVNGTEEKRLWLQYNDTEFSVDFDDLIVAVGRTARLDGYGLEELGIEVKNTVVANDYLQTLYPNIYAAGDVAGPFQFTHTAAHQAWYASVNALFSPFKKFKADYSVIPWTTFIDPEVARVGLNEQEAKEKGIAFELTCYSLDDLDRAIAESTTQGFVKVLTQPGKDKILGVTIVGAGAGELLAEFVLAMKHGLGLNKILSTIHTYPTMAEANKFAAGNWKRANAPEKLLAWVARYHRWRLGG